MRVTSFLCIGRDKAELTDGFNWRANSSTHLEEEKESSLLSKIEDQPECKTVWLHLLRFQFCWQGSVPGDQACQTCLDGIL